VSSLRSHANHLNALARLDGCKPVTWRTLTLSRCARGFVGSRRRTTALSASVPERRSGSFLRSLRPAKPIRHHIAPPTLPVDGAGGIAGYVTVAASELSPISMPATKAQAPAQASIPILRLARLAIAERAKAKAPGALTRPNGARARPANGRKRRCAGVGGGRKMKRQRSIAKLGFVPLDLVVENWANRPCPGHVSRAWAGVRADPGQGRQGRARMLVSESVHSSSGAHRQPRGAIEQAKPLPRRPTTSGNRRNSAKFTTVRFPLGTL